MKTETHIFFCKDCKIKMECSDVARTEVGAGAMFISYSNDRLIHRLNPWDVIWTSYVTWEDIDQLLQEILAINISWMVTMDSESSQMEILPLQNGVFFYRSFLGKPIWVLDAQSMCSI